jgi:hypothetical protein
MAKSYNKKYKNKKIPLFTNEEEALTLCPAKTKRYLVKEFSKRLSDVCNDQRCWLKQSFIEDIKPEIKKTLKYHTFRPKGPDGTFEWLSNYDIKAVMDQYQHKHKDFKFLGAVPIDFDKIPSYNIYNLNFQKNEEMGITKYGIIFNLDESHQSGSHWVAGYIDVVKGDLLFFDSVGDPPVKRICNLLNRAGVYIKNIKKRDINIRINRKQHQYSSSECGVFSLNFIINMIEGKTFDQYIDWLQKVNKTKDRYDCFMNRFRKEYFI